jgi:DNA-binding transcriptional LysR family regulator
VNWPSLHQLEIFCHVVRFRSMARAAELLMVTPSSISMQVQQLERRFGTVLLVRSARGTVPTANGQAIYEFATELFEGLEALQRDVASLGHLESGVLRIASGHTIGTSVIRPALQWFSGEHPEIEVSHYMLSNSERAKTEVLEGRAEIALVGRFEPEWPVDAAPLVDEPLLITMAPNHPLAALESPKASDLADFPLLLRRNYVLGHHQIVSALGRLGIHPTVEDVGSTEAVKTRAKSGTGIAILPATVVAQEVAAGTLISQSFEDFAPSRTVYLLRLPNTPLSVCAEAFLSVVRSQF